MINSPPELRLTSSGGFGGVMVLDPHAAEWRVDQIPAQHSVPRQRVDIPRHVGMPGDEISVATATGATDNASSASAFVMPVFDRRRRRPPQAAPEVLGPLDTLTAPWQPGADTSKQMPQR